MPKPQRCGAEGEQGSWMLNACGSLQLCAAGSAVPTTATAGCSWQAAPAAPWGLGHCTGGGWQMQEHSFLSMSSIFSLMLFHIYWLLLYSTGLAGQIVTSLPILCFQLRITYVQFQVPQSHFSLHQLQSLAHKHHRYIPAPFLKVTSYAAHQPFLCSQHSPYSLFPNTEQTHGPHLNSFSHFRNWGQTETSATWP